MSDGIKEGTVHLFPKYILGNICESTNVYKTSKVREYLNNTVYNGFDNSIKSALVDQDCTINTTDPQYDKVLSPRTGDVGLRWNGYSIHGTVYPLFGNGYTTVYSGGTNNESQCNSLCIYYAITDYTGPQAYWTRSVNYAKTNGLFYVTIYGSLDAENTSYGLSCRVIGSIVFAKK